MKYCKKCGKELLDEAVICPGCGCPVNGDAMHTDVKPVKSGSSVNVKKTVIISVCAFVIALAAATLLLVFKKTDVKIEDIDEVSFMGAIFKYGIPDDMEKDKTSGEWRFLYKERISIEGVILDNVIVYPNPDLYLGSKLKVSHVYRFSDDTSKRLFEKINNKITLYNTVVETTNEANPKEIYYIYYTYENGKCTITYHSELNETFKSLEYYDIEFFYN